MPPEKHNENNMGLSEITRLCCQLPYAKNQNLLDVLDTY